MGPLEAAELLHHAGVETVHISPDGAVLGVMRRELFFAEDGLPQPREWYQPAQLMEPSLREACEVYMAWRRELARDTLPAGWFGQSPQR